MTDLRRARTLHANGRTSGRARLPAWGSRSPSRAGCASSCVTPRLWAWLAYPSLNPRTPGWHCVPTLPCCRGRRGHGGMGTAVAWFASARDSLGQSGTHPHGRSRAAGGRCPGRGTERGGLARAQAHAPLVHLLQRALFGHDGRRTRRDLPLAFGAEAPAKSCDVVHDFRVLLVERRFGAGVASSAMCASNRASAFSMSWREPLLTTTRLVAAAHDDGLASWVESEGKPPRRRQPRRITVPSWFACREPASVSTRGRPICGPNTFRLGAALASRIKRGARRRPPRSTRDPVRPV